MIVNSNNLSHPSQMDQYSENYFLKRKLPNDLNCDDDDDDQNGQSSYGGQPKKRFMRSSLDTSTSSTSSYPAYHHESNCDSTNTATFSLNGIHLNSAEFNSVAGDCQNIEFLNYDENLAPISNVTVVTAAANSIAANATGILNPHQHGSAVGVAFVHEHFDIPTWSNSDLLELDHKYNTPVHTADTSSIETPPPPPPPSITTTNCGLQSRTSMEKNNEQLSEPDFEDKNLSWLFNFKLDELPHLSPEVNRTGGQLSNISNKSNKGQQTKTNKKFDELILDITSDIMDNEMTIAENIIIENSPKAPKKPPFTYTELIEYALEDKGELTVSGIYQWISDRFPFYKSNDDRWKNSVRHNLSINPHFRKGVKAPQGAGHLWTISSRDSEENALAWEHKKQRLELFFKMENSQKQTNPTAITNSPTNNNSYDEAAAAAASIVQQLRNEVTSPTPFDECHSPMCNTTNSEIMHQDDLKKTAGEILNGVRRNVEVQAIHSTISTYHESLMESGDYLNPISKDDVVIESGLRQSRHDLIGNEYYVTEIDPIELGINMSNVEEEVLFSEDFNLNYFGITSSSDIMA